MIKARAWLPSNALDPSHFERAIQELVGEWSSRWFVKVRASVRPRLREVGSLGARPPHWRSIAELCGASLDEAGRLALLEAMLDRNIAANAVQALDRPLLEDMTARCLDDLVERICAMVGEKGTPGIGCDPISSSDVMIWDVGLRRSGTSLVIAIHRSAMVRWRKRLAPAGEPVRLSGIMKALQPAPVCVDAELGNGVLTLSELENLAIDDVVILDRRTDEPVMLRAAGKATGLKGVIGEDQGKARINLQQGKKLAR